MGECCLTLSYTYTSGDGAEQDAVSLFWLVLTAQRSLALVVGAICISRGSKAATQVLVVADKL
jgi:hypothetical protein